MAKRLIEEVVYEEQCFQEALALYYEKLFPVNLIYDWLRYDNNMNMENREISFEMPRSRFIRRRSFENVDEFQRYLLKKRPIKIDIGAVFNVPPRDHTFTDVFKAVAKELVFDIDITDYNDVRTCCGEANICNKCWKFICVACKVTEAVLNSDFGFKHVLWVYSGRRGVHCWVCDKEARLLSDYERSCILSYINIIHGGVYVSRRVNLNANQIHSSIRRALNIVSEYFTECIIKEQNVLGTEDGIKKFLHLIWDAPKSFEEAIRMGKTSEERWEAFHSHYMSLRESNSLPNKLKHLKDEIMLHFMYPRFDCNVTRRMDHLLKSPFSIHPNTRRISIPFNPKLVDMFNLDKVPTLDLVLDELNKKFGEFKEEKDTFFKENNYAHVNMAYTSLSKTCNYFQTFLKRLTGSSVESIDVYSW